MKKIVSWILALSMIFSSVPTPVLGSMEKSNVIVHSASNAEENVDLESPSNAKPEYVLTVSEDTFPDKKFREFIKEEICLVYLMMCH